MESRRLMGDDIAEWQQALDLLDVYATSLIDGLTACRKPEERVRYEHRLAAATGLYLALRRRDAGSAVDRLDAEERALGWSYFEGEKGEIVHREFSHFASKLRSLLGPEA